MALMMGKLHDALVSAAVDKNLAREAAEEVAAYEDRFTQFEIRIERVDATQRLHSWMLGTNTVLLLAILGKLLLH